MRKVHISKFNKVYAEIKKKLASNDHLIQQEYFKTQQEVLVSLIKRNLGITGESGSSIHQGLVIAIVESFMEKLKNETKHMTKIINHPNRVLKDMIYINTLEFQDLIALMFAFFLKSSNNFHTVYLSFCRLPLFDSLVYTVASIDNLKFSIIVQRIFHIYISFKGVSCLPLEYKLNESWFSFKKVQHHLFTLLWRLLGIKESVSPDNVIAKITKYSTLSAIYSRSDRLATVRKLFEFYFLTYRFDKHQCYLIKISPSKKFDSPFEPHFTKCFLEDPLVLVLGYVIILGTKSTNLNEMFLFHLYYLYNRMMLLPKGSSSAHMDWEAQFLLNSFVIRKQLHKSFVYLADNFPLLQNENKARLLQVIGEYLLERFSAFRSESDLNLEQTAKLQLEQMFKILYTDIVALAPSFEQLALLRFED